MINVLAGIAIGWILATWILANKIERCKTENNTVWCVTEFTSTGVIVEPPNQISQRKR